MASRLKKLRRALPTLTTATTIALEDAGLPPERQCLTYALVGALAACHYYGRESPLFQCGNREVIVAEINNPAGPLALDYGEDDDLCIETGWVHVWVVIRPGKGLKDWWFLDLAAVHIPKLCALNALPCEIPGAPFFNPQQSIGIAKPYQLGQVRYTASERLTMQLIEQISAGRYITPGRISRETWLRVRETLDRGNNGGATNDH